MYEQWEFITNLLDPLGEISYGQEDNFPSKKLNSKSTK